MQRLAIAVGIVLVASAPAYAEDPFEPKPAERAKIDTCLKRTADDGVLKQAAQCIGLVSDPCTDKDTSTAVACQELWDEKLNAAFKDARAHVDAATGEALKEAQRAWIAFRYAKCAVLGEGI